LREKCIPLLSDDERVWKGKKKSLPRHYFTKEGITVYLGKKEKEEESWLTSRHFSLHGVGEKKK